MTAARYRHWSSNETDDHKNDRGIHEMAAVGPSVASAAGLLCKICVSIWKAVDWRWKWECPAVAITEAVQDFKLANCWQWWGRHLIAFTTWWHYWLYGDTRQYLASMQMLIGFLCWERRMFNEAENINWIQHPLNSRVLLAGEEGQRRFPVVNCWHRFVCFYFGGIFESVN